MEQPSNLVLINVFDVTGNSKLVQTTQNNF